MAEDINYILKEKKTRERIGHEIQNKNINSFNTIDKQSKANINIESRLEKHYMFETTNNPIKFYWMEFIIILSLSA